jgi:hypothetical protein
MVGRGGHEMVVCTAAAEFELPACHKSVVSQHQASCNHSKIIARTVGTFELRPPAARSSQEGCLQPGSVHSRSKHSAAAHSLS